jgi:hypothetical protein
MYPFEVSKDFKLFFLVHRPFRVERIIPPNYPLSHRVPQILPAGAAFQTHDPSKHQLLHSMAALYAQFTRTLVQGGSLQCSCYRSTANPNVTPVKDCRENGETPVLFAKMVAKRGDMVIAFQPVAIVAKLRRGLSTFTRFWHRSTRLQYCFM